MSVAILSSNPYHHSSRRCGAARSVLQETDVFMIDLWRVEWWRIAGKYRFGRYSHPGKMGRGMSGFGVELAIREIAIFGARSEKAHSRLRRVLDSLHCGD